MHAVLLVFWFSVIWCKLLGHLQGLEVSYLVICGNLRWSAVICGIQADRHVTLMWTPRKDETISDTWWSSKVLHSSAWDGNQSTIAAGQGQPWHGGQMDRVPVNSYPRQLVLCQLVLKSTRTQYQVVPRVVICLSSRMNMNAVIVKMVKMMNCHVW